MTKFDRIVKAITSKGAEILQGLIHPDFLFAVDYEMKTREKRLKEKKLVLDEYEFSILNIQLRCEDKNVSVHQGNYDFIANII